MTGLIVEYSAHKPGDLSLGSPVPTLKSRHIGVHLWFQFWGRDRDMALMASQYSQVNESWVPGVSERP